MDQLCAKPRLDGMLVHPGVEQHLGEPVWQAARCYLVHPAFEGAMLAYCRSMVEASAFRWPANKIFAQTMRYITCYMLIGLAARFAEGTGPAPTMTLLQSVVPGSSRQVSELIAGLRAGGYVVSEQNAADRREMRLRPTPPLVLEIARSPLAFIAATALIEQHTLHQALCADTERLCRVIGRSTEAFQSMDVLFAPFETVVEFSVRDSGYLLLCALMGAYLAGTQGEDWDLPLTYDTLAQRFNVSRQHVGNVLSMVTRSNLVTLRGGRIDDLDPRLFTEFSWWSAGQMAHFTTLAR